MPIPSVGNEANNSGSNAGTMSVTLTVTAAASAVVAMIPTFGGTGDDITIASVVLDPGGADDSPFTLVDFNQSTISGAERNEIWILTDPPAGTFTITATATDVSISRFFLSAAELFDVDITDATGLSGKGSGSGATASVSVTTEQADSLLIGSIIHLRGTALTPGTGVTELMDRVQTGDNGWSGHKDAPTITAHTIDATTDASDTWNMLAVEIKTDAGTDESASQPAFVEGSAEVSLYGKWYEHYHVYNGYSGHELDVVASVTFTHATEPSITTEMFYIGDDPKGNSRFAWRFVGTATGTWSWSTSSTESGLDGHTGTIEVTAQADANHRGFIEQAGGGVKRWKWTTGEVFTPAPVMYAGPDWFEDTVQLDTDITNWLTDHGFTGLLVRFVGFIWHKANITLGDIDSTDTVDLVACDAYDELFWRVYNAGGHVHVWAFGEPTDNSTGSTDYAGGANGTEDERAQRYIAARWGMLPGWTMQYGLDLSSWATDAMITTWVNNLQGWFGQPHLLGARGDQGAYTRASAAGDYTSWEFVQPSYSDLVDHITNADAGEPVFSEDKWRIQTGGSAGRNLTADDIRHLLYHCFFAGGVAGIYGHKGDSGTNPDWQDIEDGYLQSLDFPNENEIKIWSQYVADRFTATVTPDNTITDGFGLEDDAVGRRMFYKEAASTVDIDLTGITGVTLAVAVDTTDATYTEIDISGDLTENTNNTWTAPSTTDWAIVVEFTAGAIIVNQAAETDLAQAVNAAKALLVNRVIETGLAGVISPSKLLSVGLASETDLSQVVGTAKSLVLGQATEADLAQSISVVGELIVAVGQALETDLAQALGSSKLLSIGLSSETDLAQFVSAVKSASVEQVTETDLALALSSLKAIHVGQVTESDLAQAISAAKSLLVSFASESNDAQTISSAKALAIAQAIESDLSLPISAPGELIVTVGQVLESDLAQSMLWAPKHRLVNQVSEADLAQVIASLKTLSVGQITETDLAQIIGSSKTLTLSRVIEADLAQSIAVVGAIVVALGLASESDTAQPMDSLKANTIGLVTETDLARAVSIIKSLEIGLATELDIAQSLSREKINAIGQVTESDLAQAIATAKALQIVLATESDEAQGVAWAPKHRLVRQVQESDEALNMTLASALAIIRTAFKGMYRGSWKKME